MAKQPARPGSRSTKGAAGKAAKSDPKSQSKSHAKSTAQPSAKSTAKTAKASNPAVHARRGKAQQVDPQKRYQMIAEAAYLLAEEDGFDANRSLDHWLAAEALIDARLGGRVTH